MKPKPKRGSPKPQPRSAEAPKNRAWLLAQIAATAPEQTTWPAHLNPLPMANPKFLQASAIIKRVSNYHREGRPLCLPSHALPPLP